MYGTVLPSAMGTGRPGPDVAGCNDGSGGPELAPGSWRSAAPCGCGAGWSPAEGLREPAEPMRASGRPCLHAATSCGQYGSRSMYCVCDPGDAKQSLCIVLCSPSSAETGSLLGAPGASCGALPSPTRLRLLCCKVLAGGRERQVTDRPPDRFPAKVREGTGWHPAWDSGRTLWRMCPRPAERPPQRCGGQLPPHPKTK